MVKVFICDKDTKVILYEVVSWKRGLSTISGVTKDLNLRENVAESDPLATVGGHQPTLREKVGK